VAILKARAFAQNEDKLIVRCEIAWCEIYELEFQTNFPAGEAE
jgi:hypothetical protein